MIITNDENIKPIYEFKNKRSGFPKAEIIIAFEFAVLGVSSLTLKVNQSPSRFVNISKKNEISAKQALSIGKDDSGLFNANQLTRITNEVGKMSEVTQKDLNESEKYFDNKLDKKFDKLDKKFDKLDEKIANLPSKEDVTTAVKLGINDWIKDRKQHNFDIWKSIVIPLIAAIIGALFTKYF